MTTWKPERPRRSEVDPRPVAESLDRVARRIGAPPVDVLGAVFGRWADLVGATVADHATPVSLRRGVLTVEVDSPAWATQLRLLSGDLRARVAEVPGAADAVREVRLVVRRH
ncbi:MAG TPA: DUF721 domain-containing protein [Acidimicrobiales bacterium]|nr:DUF721 domain-containing protein [Acidimicrobiales bacterium]